MSETKIVEKKEETPEIKYHIRPTHFFTYDLIDRTWDLEVHLPGVSKENLQVRFLDNTYDIYARRGPAEYSITECVPFDFDLDSIEAIFEDGLLSIKGKIKDPLADAKEIKLD